jgi:hypothetical protein
MKTLWSLVLLSLAASSACSSSNKGAANGGITRPPPTSIVSPAPTPLDGSCPGATMGPFEASLQTPHDIKVEEDDNTVRLQWNGALHQNPGAYGDNVEGYRICWGTAEEGPVHGALWTQNVAQLFGVKNGADHVALIQSVDSHGRISAPSETVHFKGDPARVDKLRQEMTGFFDDFNGPEGALDELKWNSVFVGVDPTAGWSFVTKGQHAVNYIGNHTYLPGSVEHGGRAQTLIRARPIFDFAGREGRITFDMAGTFSDRITWYVDVIPYATPADLIDMTGHATFDPGPGNPGRFIRFSQSRSLVQIHQHDATGHPIAIKQVDVSNVSPDIMTGRAMPMRHFELRVAKNHAAIYIDGLKAIENDDINLDYERGIVQWSIFGYNPIKIFQRWARLDFDNIGFDGPPPTQVVHNYKPTFTFVEYSGESHKDVTWTQPIPDSLEGATSIRFFYTLNAHQIFWDPGDPNDPTHPPDHFVINGMTIPLPEPKSPCGTWQDGTLGGDDEPYSASIELPPGLLKGGPGAVNTFAFNANKSAVENVHVEAYFEPGKEPPYTQPSAYAMPILPSFEPIGAFGEINQFNGDPVDLFSQEAGTEIHVSYAKPLSGKVTCNMHAETIHQELADGHGLGIARLDLVVDGITVSTASSAARVAAPEIDDGPVTNYQRHPSTFDMDFDTTQLSNGAHVLEVRAFDSAGSFFATPFLTDPGVHITIQN